MKTFGIILIALIAVLVVIQFFHPSKNISTAKSPNDMAVVHNVPANVRTILDKACNDCHSNNTRYPWYNNVQPVAWWLDHHVQEGKRELNFNEFAAYPLRKQYHKLEEVTEMVEEGEMPMSSYTLIHSDARLTDQEKETLINWANSLRSEMKAKYPADSLVRKR
ncbi:MAG: hypothetical protein AVDCRST_MAG96-729 [uncultured Segetibacter sp.]|uniref:Haem-binding domain-containing protein n=1 Tax=uncultured Segetibacter sp. TaxID=481133 RepID=A0A6J4RSB3_9BACT|nr:MAG: hypothetical protein AVDCRST_MAG96-729 [uncultured Segetibacter sp.]